jgi:hypothetical protein
MMKQYSGKINRYNGKLGSFEDNRSGGLHEQQLVVGWGR